jgi:hypothetical protein
MSADFLSYRGNTIFKKYKVTIGGATVDGENSAIEILLAHEETFLMT